MKPAVESTVRTWITKIIVIASLAMFTVYAARAVYMNDSIALDETMRGMHFLLGMVMGYYFAER